LNKADLADPVLTGDMGRFFFKNGGSAAAVDSLSGRGIRLVPGLVQQLTAEKMASLASSGRRPRPGPLHGGRHPQRGEIIFYQKADRPHVTKTEDRPGITGAGKWIRVGGSLDLMDTPGVLWPKFEDAEVAFRLAGNGRY
jgi:ribosome biogenesis GTPase A